MKKITLFLIIAVAAISCNQPKKQTAKSVLSDLLANYKKHSSISYFVKYRMKYFDYKDTSSISADCKLIRDKKDTIFNGYVWFKSKWGRYLSEKYYDLDSIYIIDDSLKTIKTYYDPKTQYWAIEGNTTGFVIDIPFLDTSRLVKAIHDSGLTEIISNDKVNNIDCWKVSIKYPNSGKDQFEISNHLRCYWISKNDTELRRITYHATLQNEDEYEEWNIDSITLDKETPESLKSSMKIAFSTYKMERYLPPSPESQKPLANGLFAPIFAGTDFATGKKLSLADYKGKIVLLDFWYMSCYWCCQAMPAIEKIRDEFASKGLVVLGINSYDTSAEQQKKLPDFIKINKNTYSTVLTSHNTDKTYNVHGYPTLYLIDRKGKIAYSDIGYRKNLDSVLTVEIEKLLK